MSWKAGLSEQVRAFAEMESLFRHGEGVVMAVSGGADSMALSCLLLDLRAEWDLRLIVAHLDHELRGEAGRQDCAFVQAWAESMGLPFVAGRRPVAQWAREQGASLEAAARDVRYAFLADVAAAHGAAAVATGHTRNDQAETVLLRLLRGAGVAGLSGIMPCSTLGEMRLVRPLLFLSREELLPYLKGRRQPFREDASNQDRRFLRNRLRHEVLPYIESVFETDVRNRLVRAAELLRTENEWMEALTREALETVRASDRPAQLDTEKVAALPLAARRRVVRAWLEEMPGAPLPDFCATARILALIESRAGSRLVPLPGGWRVVRVYGRLMADPPASGDPQGGALALACPGETVWPELGLRIRVERTLGCLARAPRGIGRWPAAASVCRRDEANTPLLLRTWRPGDRIAPSGMSGSRKVHDVFVDEKVARDRRRSIPLLWSGDELVWIPGYSVSRHWLVEGEEAPSWTLYIEAENEA